MASPPRGWPCSVSGFRPPKDETDPEGIIVRSSRVDLNAFPHLLAVARAGAGVNNIPVEEATNRGICVFNTPGANANAVVELVYTMLGIWLRHAHEGILFCSSLAGLQGKELERTVEEQKKRFRGVEMTGKTLGVIGLGMIGVAGGERRGISPDAGRGL